MKQFIRQYNQLFMRKGVLYCKTKISSPERSTMQLVLPTAYRKQALQGCHDDLGHLGMEQTIDLLRDCFYWPGMLIDTIKQCLGFKALPEKALMENIDATYPMELVHMDYLTIEANEGGKDVHILVIMDHFTCYAQAIITSSQTAKCTAQNLWDKFIVHYGLPEEILTDQGNNFESDLLGEQCEVAQIKKIVTFGYHPQTNGQCEHFNATLINMLGTLPEKPKSTWIEQVPMLVHAHNCMRNNVTDFSLYYLTFGRKPHVPIDIIFGTNTAELKDNASTKHVENLKLRLKWGYKTANEVVKKEQE